MDGTAVGRSNSKSGLPDRLLTIEEVAELCGVSTRTVRRWIDQDQLPAVRIDRVVRVAERDLQQFLDRHRTCD